MKHLKEIMMKDPAIPLPALAYFVRMHKCKRIDERQSADCIQPPARIGDESKNQGK